MAAVVNGRALVSAPLVPEKPVAHARKVDVASLFGQIRLFYLVLCALVVHLALQSLLIMELA